MRKVKYKCGYCNSEFELSFFNEQEIRKEMQVAQTVEWQEKK